MPDSFSPPGNVGDFTDQQRVGWSELIDHWVSAKIASLTDDNGEPVAFFNERLTPVPPDAAEAAIDWDAFPLTLKLGYDTDGARQESGRLLSVAGSYGLQKLYENVDGTPQPIDLFYRNQDEYCEWRPTVDATTGEMTRISFTSEGPEYWEYIASGSDAFRETDNDGNETWSASTPAAADPSMLLDLYRQFAGPQVEVDDLFHRNDIVAQDRGRWVRVFAKGTYNPYNKWNTTDGVVHMTHPANLLQAEIDLAGTATVPRHDAHGEPITGTTQFVCCSGFGSATRSSDPTIGATVNSLVRQHLSVAMRDPVGVYMKTINYGAFEGPNGEDGTAYWRIVRGQEGTILRAELSVPDGVAYPLSAVRVAGEPLRSGAQVAEQIRMSLYGKAHDFGQGLPPTRSCVTHCCTSQVNRNLLQVIDGTTSCDTLNTPGETWKESFPDLTPAAIQSLADVGVGDIESLPRRPARRGRMV